MSRFFKNCGHLSKPTADNLLPFPIFIKYFNFTEKCALVSVECNQFKNKKNFIFNLLLIADKKKHYEMLIKQ